MTDPSAPGNDKNRLQWFSDIGFGLFIHWSIDSQIGSVIGHSMADASEDYLKKYIEVLPATFNPKKFDPDEWALLARLAGVRYVVFTTKHHSGFCMFHTATTPFNIANTPFSRDLTGEVIEAFRKQGIAIGLYFSPDDFYFLRQKGLPLRRGVRPEQCEGLLDYNKAQLGELLRNYGKIDILFFDGPAAGLPELCWSTDPQIVVTRGAIQTPEQYIPGLQSDEPWEACVTMGTGWQYKPTNERYKSGTQLIELLIETRAKGGNLLLNVGPKPDGELPIQQEERLREIALWNFVNDEAVYGVRPWRVPCEGDTWFTAKPDEGTVYAFITKAAPWPLRQRRDLSLRSVQSSERTTVHVLGQADDLTFNDRAAVEWHQQGDQLQISATRAQRLYNDRRWPNPVVLKITQAQLGLVPPTVITQEAVWDTATARCLLQARLVDLAPDAHVEVGFQYRLRKLLTDPADPWQESPFHPMQEAGQHQTRIDGLPPNQTFEFRAVARQAGLLTHGDHQAFKTR